MHNLNETSGERQLGEESGTGEKVAKSLILGQFATEMGYEGNADPQSLLEIIASTRRERGVDYVPALNRAHEMGLLSDEASSNTVDSLRYLLETSTDRSTPFYKLATEQAGDISADEVLERWGDLEVLFGITRDTSKSTLDEDEKKPIAERRIKYADRIKSGSIAFESQGGGGEWGAGSTWQRP
jgi:hypothetical protein